MLLDISSLGLLSSWAALLAYALQIYFDFSGYSDMAIGLGRLFGIELPLNFRNPYRAVNPSDFWTRWHITLSRWLRDYLYITLGGNRCSEARRSFNLMATMVLGGLWHGASWTFAAWGFYHGALLIAYHHSSRRWDRMPVAVQVGLNFILVCLGWVFFRAQTFHDAATWFGRLFGLYGLGLELLSRPHFELLVLVTLGLIFIRLVSEAYQKPEFDLEGLSAPIAVALGISAGGAILLMNFSSKFLYFQF
ncbi:MAG: MBOAT family protein [Deltaproteobacteria bacterium]|nr:MBOAT family protein [Deltaproteobacteria bacterium]